jgi:hypothetical protein
MLKPRKARRYGIAGFLGMAKKKPIRISALEKNEKKRNAK